MYTEESDPKRVVHAAERKQKPEHYTGIRYIACQIDGSTHAYNEPGFAPCEPPVLVDGETVVQVTYAELLAIKDADKRKKPVAAQQTPVAPAIMLQDCPEPLPF